VQRSRHRKPRTDSVALIQPVVASKVFIHKGHIQGDSGKVQETFRDQKYNQPGNQEHYAGNGSDWLVIYSDRRLWFNFEWLKTNIFSICFE
jgi:hypothetical protein